MKKLLFNLQSGETVLRSEVGILLLGGIKNRFGWVCLTNQRLVFVKNNPFLRMMLGLIGFLIEHFIEKWNKPIVIDLPLSMISRVEQGKFGLNKKVIVVHTRGGETYKISTTKSYEEWEAAFKGLLKK